MNYPVSYRVTPPRRSIAIPSISQARREIARFATALPYNTHGFGGPLGIRTQGSFGPYSATGFGDGELVTATPLDPNAPAFSANELRSRTYRSLAIGAAVGGAVVGIGVYFACKKR